MFLSSFNFSKNKKVRPKLSPSMHEANSKQVNKAFKTPNLKAMFVIPVTNTWKSNHSKLECL